MDDDYTNEFDRQDDAYQQDIADRNSVNGSDLSSDQYREPEDGTTLDNGSNTDNWMKSLAGEVLGPSVDKGLLSTIGGFFKDNKELSSMLMQGFGSAMKGEQLLQLQNRMRENTLEDRKMYSDSVAGIKTVQPGLIGSNFMQRLRGAK